MSIFSWWVLQHCTGFARLVWGRLRVHRAFVYSDWFVCYECFCSLLSRLTLLGLEKGQGECFCSPRFVCARAASVCYVCFRSLPSRPTLLLTFFQPIFVRVRVCANVCVCVRARKRDRECECECVCVCVCARARAHARVWVCVNIYIK